MNYKKLVIVIIGLALLLIGCKSQEVPGRQRAPRHCNSCTKWSYMPQDLLNSTDLVGYEA